MAASDKSEVSGAAFAVHLVKLWGFPGTDDNYSYIIRDIASGECFVVDPAIASEVLTAFAAVQKSHATAKIVGVLNTHRHKDHSRGNAAIVRAFPDQKIEVYGGKDDNKGLGADAFTIEFDPSDDEITLDLGVGTVIRVIHSPSHTRGHVLYVVEAKVGGKTSTESTSADSDESEKGKIAQAPALFSGDTLFTGGVGFFFEEEGDGADMLKNFKKIGVLADETLVYPGHEYAVSNLQFGRFMEPENADLRLFAEWCAARKDGVCVPTTVAQEKAHNVFMRTDVESVQSRVRDLWAENVESLREPKSVLSKVDFTKEHDYMMALRLLKNLKSLWRKSPL